MRLIELTLSDDPSAASCKVELANNPLTRLRGLLGRKGLEEGCGLWISPCNSIHMLGMRFAIDAVFLSKNMQIVRIVPELGPWRAVWPVSGAHSVVELPSGWCARSGWKEGQILNQRDLS
jgi:uncharacterized membrane protein (UPF0127 family)